MELKYLGKSFNEAIDELDVIPARAGLSLVAMSSNELTCVCPINEQPDYYQVRIEYTPDTLCVESKSLKLYLMHFRDLRLFCEDLAVIIRDKVVETIHPKYCKVSLTQSVRGGIVIEAASVFGQADPQ
jgi:7-cyano-7-deazaguanine reductase